MQAFIILGLVGTIYGGLFVGRTGGWHPIKSIPQEVETFAKAYVQKQNMDVKTLEVSPSHMQGQVVAGMNYKFRIVVSNNQDTTTTECMFNVYARFDGTISMNEPVTCAPAMNRRQLVLGGHHVPLAGGVSTVDVNDKSLQGAIDAVSKHINMMSNSMMHLTAVSVTHPTKQVIRGLRFTFDVDFQEAAGCRNDEKHMTATLADCPPADGGMKLSYHCTVIDVAWETPRYTTKCTQH